MDDWTFVWWPLSFLFSYVHFLCSYSLSFLYLSFWFFLPSIFPLFRSFFLFSSLFFPSSYVFSFLPSPHPCLYLRTQTLYFTETVCTPTHLRSLLSNFQQILFLQCARSSTAHHWLTQIKISDERLKTYLATGSCMHSGISGWDLPRSGRKR